MPVFDRRAWSLVPGHHVKATITGHAPWGVFATVAGEADVPASIDGGLIDSPSGSPRALAGEYPPIGAEVDAVVTEIDRYLPHVLIRLSIRAADREALSRRCAFCDRWTVVSPGGDGITVDARSADGPPSTWFAVHRACLIERMHPDAVGEPQRVARLGRS